MKSAKLGDELPVVDSPRYDGFLVGRTQGNCSYRGRMELSKFRYGKGAKMEVKKMKEYTRSLVGYRSRSSWWMIWL